MFDGTIYSAEATSQTFGNYIIIESIYGGDTIYVLYAHLNSCLVNNGDSVSAGSIIGKTGVTGNAANSEPHVHIEVRKQIPQHGYNNTPHFNPENYLSTKFDSEGNPIPPDNCN